MINEKIKQIVEGFLNSVKLPAILIGTYNGTGVQIDELLKLGDKVRVFAPTGWDEFYILEIIGKPYTVSGGSEWQKN